MCMASLLYHIYQQEEEHESNTGMVQYLQHQDKNRVDIWKSAYNLRQERWPVTFCEVFAPVTHSGEMIARPFMRLRGGSTWKSRRFIMAISQKAHLGFWIRRKI